MNRTLDLVGPPGEALDTQGGPLVMLPLKDVPRWTFADHYEPACELTEWLEVMDIGDLPSVVFGDEPALTWIQSAADGQRVIFRSIYQPEDFAPSGRLVLSPDARIQEDLEVSPGGDYLLFDSAFDGDSVIEGGLGLLLKLPECGFVVETYEYKPTPDVFLVAHLFRPATNPTQSHRQTL